MTNESDDTSAQELRSVIAKASDLVPRVDPSHAQDAETLRNCVEIRAQLLALIDVAQIGLMEGVTLLETDATRDVVVTMLKEIIARIERASLRVTPAISSAIN